MSLSVLSKAQQAFTLQQIVQPILPSLELVEDRLKSVGAESNGILQESSHYVLAGGGKRLRAALVLFCAEQKKLSETQRSAAVDIAAAVELIHAATLVHDDIIDRAVLRRLRPTVGVQFGDDMAVLLGDFLYARAFEMVAQAGNAQITHRMAKTTRDMCEGEIDQLKYRFRANLSFDEYVSFIERKTASLIAACAYGGALIGGHDAASAERLHSFGMNIGISYQIVDDLLDIIGSENKVGKTLHTDANNGKLTLPFILLRDKLQGDENAHLMEILKGTRSDWAWVQPLLERHSIAAETGRCSDQYFDAALESISAFPSPFKDHLDKLSRFILKRDY